VDFRELIKRMAEEFRIRIEMRQIGMRQEASRLGGIGSCGRELCCATWLTDFKTVSTAAARYQNLSLNTLKLAGQCGKLKCCLNYELDSYMDALKDFPRNIERIETEKGTAYLQKTDIFKKLMWFSYPGEENWMALSTTRVKEINQLNKEGIKPEDVGAIVKEDTVEEKPVVYDYENVVGQDSLTRLDDRNKKKRKSGKNKRRPEAKKNGGPKQAANPSLPTETAPKQAKSEPLTGETKPQRSKRRFRGNNHKKGKDGGQPNAGS